MLTHEQADLLAHWYVAERARRTRAVRAGNAPMAWIVPQYRVQFSETAAYAESIGITLNPLDRIELDAAIKRCRRIKP